MNSSTHVTATGAMYTITQTTSHTIKVTNYPRQPGLVPTFVYCTACCVPIMRLQGLRCGHPDECMDMEVFYTLDFTQLNDWNRGHPDREVDWNIVEGNEPSPYLQYGKGVVMGVYMGSVFNDIESAFAEENNETVRAKRVRPRRKNRTPRHWRNDRPVLLRAREPDGPIFNSIHRTRWGRARDESRADREEASSPAESDDQGRGGHADAWVHRRVA